MSVKTPIFFNVLQKHTCNCMRAQKNLSNVPGIDLFFGQRSKYIQLLIKSVVLLLLSCFCKKLRTKSAREIICNQRNMLHASCLCSSGVTTSPGSISFFHGFVDIICCRKKIQRLWYNIMPRSIYGVRQFDFLRVCD